MKIVYIGNAGRPMLAEKQSLPRKARPCGRDLTIPEVVFFLVREFTHFVTVKIFNYFKTYSKFH